MVRFVLHVTRVKRLTVVMIEHDMGAGHGHLHRVAVLDFGKKIAEGTPAHVPAPTPSRHQRPTSARTWKVA